jgi:hypothetical protein
LREKNGHCCVSWAGIKTGTCGKNNCILDRRETDVLQNKRFVLLIGLVPPMMTAERRRLIEQNILANHVQ